MFAEGLRVCRAHAWVAATPSKITAPIKLKEPRWLAAQTPSSQSRSLANQPIESWWAAQGLLFLTLRAGSATHAQDGTSQAHSARAAQLALAPGRAFVPDFFIAIAYCRSLSSLSAAVTKMTLVMPCATLHTPFQHVCARATLRIASRARGQLQRISHACDVDKPCACQQLQAHGSQRGVAPSPVSACQKHSTLHLHSKTNNVQDGTSRPPRQSARPTFRLMPSTRRPRKKSSSTDLASRNSGAFSNCSPTNTKHGCAARSADRQRQPPTQIKPRSGCHAAQAFVLAQIRLVAVPVETYAA